MTNQKTPVQGGATEEQIEAAVLRGIDSIPLSDMDYWQKRRGQEATAAVMAELRHLRIIPEPFSVSTSARPADERHDTEALRRVVALCDQQDARIDSMGGGFPRQLDVTTIRAAIASDEHHDAEEREAEPEDHAATEVGEARLTRGSLIEAMKRGEMGRQAAWTAYGAEPEGEGTRPYEDNWYRAEAILAAFATQFEVCSSHRPVQHRDAKEPWCKACGLTGDGREPNSRLRGCRSE